MRELTFKGFLKEYVRDLSHQNTNSIYKLVHETVEQNPRLYEPLFLYASFSNKKDEFFNAAKRTENFNFERLPDVKISEGFNQFDALPQEYAKVYNTFLYRKNKVKNDAHTKQLMHTRIKQLQKERGISNYKIYTQLSLNPGNFNAFMKHGDANKISLELLKSVIEYLEKHQ